MKPTKHKLTIDNPFTIVINLTTGEEFIYNLPPKKAVVYAWFQYSNKNKNWWDYREHSRPVTMVGKYTYMCGDWSALKGK
jgi:hypothetical protein